MKRLRVSLVKPYAGLSDTDKTMRKLHSPESWWTVAAFCTLVIALTDFGIASSKVPPVPPPCPGFTDTNCNAARSEVFPERLERIDTLEKSFRGRESIYFVVIALGLSAAAFIRLRRQRPGNIRRTAANVGSVGVCAGLGAVLFLFITGPSAVDPKIGPLFLPALSLMSVAAFFTFFAPKISADSGRGTSVHEANAGISTQEETTAATSPNTITTQGLTRTILFATGLTFLLALLALAIHPGCESSGSSAEELSGAVLSGAALSAAIAMFVALISLFHRHWVVAAAGLAVNPVIVIFGWLATACLS